MAKEIWFNYPSTATFYAIIHDKSTEYIYINAGLGTFEAYNPANWDTYDIPLSLEAPSYYSADFPADIPAGNYNISVYLQEGSYVTYEGEYVYWENKQVTYSGGGSPAITDGAAAYGELFWNGAEEILISSLSENIGSSDIVADDVPVSTPGLFSRERRSISHRR